MAQVLSSGSAKPSAADLERAQKALPDIVFDDFGYGMAKYITRANMDHFQKHLEPSDIIVASYPKSGTNWVKQVVHAIRLGGDLDVIQKHEDTDLSVLINIPDAIANFNFDEVNHIKPRAFFSHAQYQDTPKGGRIIYVIREMAGALPSYFKYVGSFDGNFVDHTIDDVAQLMMDGLLYCGTWEDHVAGFWEHRKDPDVLIVKYEDMRKDLPREVSRIAGFLGIELTKEGLETVVKVSSLDYMKERSDKIQGKDWAKEVTGQAVAESYKLVDGSGHKDVMTPELTETLRKYFQEKAAPKLGSPATYGDIVVD